MNSPHDSFTIEAGVRLRPVPEMGACLAYTRARPALHRLNAASWLIVSLCDGRSLGELTMGYQAAMPGKAGGHEGMIQGLQELLELGIVRRVSPEVGAAAQSPSAKEEFLEL